MSVVTMPVVGKPVVTMPVAAQYLQDTAQYEGPIRVESLESALYASLFGLSDGALEARGIRRQFASAEPGINYPCRVSLGYAQAGEELLLLSHRHLDMPGTPYRAEGPVYVRRIAQAYARKGEFPEIILQRAMAVRAYDASGMMIAAELAEKEALKQLTREYLARPDIAHVDFHSARRGCFFCRIRRA